MTTIEKSLSSVKTIGAPKVLGEHVVSRLRHLIVTGRIAPGTHLVETDLAGAFGVSRGPVREALRQLLTEGLVGSRRGRMYVIGVTASDVQELYHLRFLIESEALRLVVQSEAGKDPALRRALDELHGASVSQDADTYAMADLDFHTAFYAVAGHRRLQDVWLMYRPTFAGILAVTNAEDLDLAPSYDDHVVLLEAIEQRNLPRALEVLQGHLEGSKQRFLTAHERQQENAATQVE